MVPLADMLNAADDFNTHWTYDNEKRGFLITARRDIALGEELTDTYGQKDNYSFFLFYGFILNDEVKKLNFLCFYPLDLTINEKKTPGYTWKKKIWDVSESPDKEFRLSRKVLGHEFQSFMMWYRFLLYDGKDKITIEKCQKPISLNNELLVWEGIQKMMR